MQQVVLFDVDGTLLNSGSAGRLAAAEVLQRPYETPPDGTAESQIIPEALHSSYLLALERHLDHSMGYEIPGARKFIEILLANKHKIATASCNRCEAVDLKLKRFKFNKYPWETFGCACTSPNKGLIVKSSVLGLRYCGYRKSQITMVGDSPSDVRAAQLAGISCIAVTTGSYTRKDLQAAGKCWVVDSLAQLVHPRQLIRRDLDS